ncbi:Bgh specific hypothetical protein [Blumeria hordei DH14]|uniref:Uncharacterized protein n=1 Tax=Blumeria graminis f. sp. hordei (strain DH14) TaxID=546991 RepID=N1JQ00_BLUG1|nr:Bgh specific hypothetical protein [Blumeria hordei DH14]
MSPANSTMSCGDETPQNRNEHHHNTHYRHPRPWTRLAPLPPRRQFLKRNGSHGPSAYLIRAIRRHSLQKKPVIVRKSNLKRCNNLHTSLPTQRDLATAMERLDISDPHRALWVPQDASVMDSTDRIGSESPIRHVGMKSPHSPTQYVTAQSSLVTHSKLYIKTQTLRASGTSPLEPIGFRLLTSLLLGPPQKESHIEITRFQSMLFRKKPLTGNILFDRGTTYQP